MRRLIEEMKQNAFGETAHYGHTAHIVTPDLGEVTALLHLLARYVVNTQPTCILSNHYMINGIVPPPLDFCRHFSHLLCCSRSPKYTTTGAPVLHHGSQLKPGSSGMMLLDPDSFTEGLSLNEVATRCREESAKSLQHRDPRYCFELFRRAIVGEDKLAWAAVYAQYHALVRRWLGGVADVEDVVQETFARFSKAVTAERFINGEFPSLGKLLAFLRRIAINLRINEERRAVRERRAFDAWFQQDQATVTPDHVERVIRQELAEYVQGLLKDEQEWLVLRLTYEFELPPREIVRRYPQHFEDLDEVYRVKERLRKRLRRDPRLGHYLDK